MSCRRLRSFWFFYLLEREGKSSAVTAETLRGKLFPLGRLHLAVAQVLAYVYPIRQYRAGKDTCPDLRRDA